MSPEDPQRSRPRIFLRICLAALIYCAWLPAGDDLSLERKAALFAHDLAARFQVEGQVAPKLRLPTPERNFVSYNMPDNTYMTGIYLGTEALRYAATRSPEARRKGAEALEALLRLHEVTGTTGFPARAFWPVARPFFDDGDWRPAAGGKYRWRGDVSCDQVTGAMYGFALFHELAANAEEKKRIARVVEQVMGRILDHGFRIVGPDDKTTTWGHYEREYVTAREPMNALLLLQHLLVARQVTGLARFREAYDSVARSGEYAGVAVKARRMGDPFRPGAVNHSDDVLLFLAYYPLLRYERDAQLRALYLRSLERTWNGDGGFPGVASEANPFFTYIYLAAGGARQAPASRTGGSGRRELLDRARNTLQWFPLDMKWNKATMAAYAKQFAFRFDAAPVSPAPVDGGPVPLDRRPKTWSAWVQDPYRAGQRASDSTMEYQGLDFLMAYWLGRAESMIND